MRKETKILLIILIVPVVWGELLFGATTAFLQPLSLVLFIPAYGFSLLLIHEAKARWKMQWSTILLGVAFGVLFEGLMLKSIFNIGWGELQGLTGYGMYFGIQWPYAIMRIAFHATISMMIPLLIIETIWPEFKTKQLVGRRGLSVASAGLAGAIMVGYAFFGTITADGMRPHYLDPALVFVTLSTVALLIWFAYELRHSRLSTFDMVLWKPFLFGVSGFLFQSFNLFIPYSFVGIAEGAATTIILQIALMFTFLMFLYYQFAHQNVTKKHVAGFVIGSILFYILIAPLQEIGQHLYGMIIVALLSIFFLYVWAHMLLLSRTSY